eukprot:GCRY01000847.1.p1 GENE.GCRY01000847.1~~GCRY01000847.1.p1  ORF type:complete len:1383 (+),score=420.73 GCRY01000847.1:228-4376(+)
MGVQGLTTLVEKFSVGKTTQFRSDTPKETFVFDGYSLVTHLYFSFSHDRPLNFVHGGQYDDFALRVHDFFTIMKSCNIESFVVFDGALHDIKKDTCISRESQRIESLHKCFYSKPDKYFQVLPHLCVESFLQIAKQDNIPVVSADYEADSVVSWYCKKVNGIAVSNDSDFFIYDIPKGFAPLKEFSVGKDCVMLRLFDNTSISSSLGFDHKLNPLFASLAGNDYVSRELLEAFHRFVLNNHSPSSKLKNDGRRHVLLKSLACYLSQFNSVEEGIEATVTLIKEINSDVGEEVLRKQIFDSLREYDVAESEEDLLSNNYSSLVKGNLPSGVVSLFRGMEFPEDLVNVLNAKLWWCSTIVEDSKEHESVYAIAADLRSICAGILLGAPEQYTEYIRKGNQMSQVNVTAQALDIPNLNELFSYPVEDRKKMFVSAIGCTELDLPEEWLLPVYTLRYWLQMEGDGLQLCDLAAILGCFTRTTTPPEVKQYKERNVVASTVHRMSKWQVLFRSMLLLNKVLLSPFPTPPIGKIYDGMVLYYLLNVAFRGGFDMEQMQEVGQKGASSWGDNEVQDMLDSVGADHGLFAKLFAAVSDGLEDRILTTGITAQMDNTFLSDNEGGEQGVAEYEGYDGAKQDPSAVVEARQAQHGHRGEDRKSRKSHRDRHDKERKPRKQRYEKNAEGVALDQPGTGGMPIARRGPQVVDVKPKSFAHTTAWDLLQAEEEEEEEEGSGPENEVRECEDIQQPLKTPAQDIPTHPPDGSSYSQSPFFPATPLSESGNASGPSYTDEPEGSLKRSVYDDAEWEAHISSLLSTPPLSPGQQPTKGKKEKRRHRDNAVHSSRYTDPQATHTPAGAESGSVAGSAPNRAAFGYAWTQATPRHQRAPNSRRVASGDPPHSSTEKDSEKGKKKRKEEEEEESGAEKEKDGGEGKSLELAVGVGVGAGAVAVAAAGNQTHPSGKNEADGRENEQGDKEKSTGGTLNSEGKNSQGSASSSASKKEKKKKSGGEEEWLVEEGETGLMPEAVGFETDISVASGFKEFLRRSDRQDEYNEDHVVSVQDYVVTRPQTPVTPRKKEDGEKVEGSEAPEPEPLASPPPSKQSLPTTPSEAVDGAGSRLSSTTDQELWYAPENRLHVTYHPRDVTLAQQFYLCGFCGCRLSGGFLSKERWCYYTGKFYCKDCHTGQKQPIPAYIVGRWDFKPRPVAVHVDTYLKNIFKRPMLKIQPSGLKDGLYHTVDEMKRVRILRQQLCRVRDYILTCGEADHLLHVLHPRYYLMHDPDVYSLADLAEVKSGTLAVFLARVVEQFVAHVYNCARCQGKGYICEVCSDPTPIFPFQLSKTLLCPDCRALFHRHCLLPGMCPKCLRLRDRSKADEKSPPKWECIEDYF